MDTETGGLVWPMPKFYFSVDISNVGTDLLFQEVTGLDSETMPIEYRADNAEGFSPINMPGIAKVSNVVLKKGIFVNDNKFLDWYAKISMNTIRRETVTIKLLDEAGKPTMTWRLANAWPTKVSGTDLKPEGNEVAIESLELAHEGVTVLNP